MNYIRKTKNEYQLWINYGYGDGWEHELSEDTQKAIFERKQEYKNNCHQYPVKIKTARVKIKYEIVKMSEVQTGQNFYDTSILENKPYIKYLMIEKPSNIINKESGLFIPIKYGKSISGCGYNLFNCPQLGVLHYIKDNFNVCIQVEVR